MGPSPPSILPSDVTLFERSKSFSTTFADFVKKEDFVDIEYDDIGLENDNDESESDNSLSVIEDECSSSDDFDVQNLLNETLPVKEERVRKWKESGMDKVMESFNLNEITEKFGAWLKEAVQGKTNMANSSTEMEHVIHYENHQVNFCSDESLQSADTATYILSNRKPKSASCVRMTIKSFRFGKKRREEMQKKFKYMNESDADHKKGNIAKKSLEHCKAITQQGTLPQKRESKSLSEKTEAALKSTRRKSRQRRRSEMLRKRSLSDSSSSDSAYNRSFLPPLTRNRRVRKKAIKEGDLEPVALSNSLNKPTVSPNTKPDTSAESLEIEQPPAEDISIAKSLNNNGLSVILNNNNECAPSLIDGPDNRKIVLYTPKNKALYSNYIADGRLKITEEYFRSKVSRKTARRFLAMHSHKFPLIFGTSSEIYFEIPVECTVSSTDDEDEDPIDIAAKGGRIVVADA